MTQSLANTGDVPREEQENLKAINLNVKSTPVRRALNVKLVKLVPAVRNARSAKSTSLSVTTRAPLPRELNRFNLPPMTLLLSQIISELSNPHSLNTTSNTQLSMNLLSLAMREQTMTPGLISRANSLCLSILSIPIAPSLYSKKKSHRLLLMMLKISLSSTWIWLVVTSSKIRPLLR